MTSYVFGFHIESRESLFVSCYLGCVKVKALDVFDTKFGDFLSEFGSGKLLQLYFL